jgi:acetolactate decarboxylase
MVRLIIWGTLTPVVLSGGTLPARAEEACQVARISSLLAGGYDGDTTVDEMLRHGDFGLGTLMVLARVWVNHRSCLMAY